MTSNADTEPVIDALVLVPCSTKHRRLDAGRAPTRVRPLGAEGRAKAAHGDGFEGFLVTGWLATLAAVGL